MPLDSLRPLFESTSTLPSVGEKTFTALQRINCSRIIDLLLHFPYEVTTHLFYPDLSKVPPKSSVVIKLEIQDIKQTFTKSRKKITKIFGFDGQNSLTLVYFNYAPYYIINKLVIGNKYVVSGKLEQAGVAEYQLTHPEIYLSDDHLKKLEPKYPLTYATTSKQISNLVKSGIDRVPNIAEWLPAEILRKHNFSSWLDSVKLLHNPASGNDLHPNSLYRQRLVFDEFLASQLALKLIRSNKNCFTKGCSISIEHKLRDNVLNKKCFD
jgi:ATP-dependent DNA helicase RecG